MTTMDKLPEPVATGVDRYAISGDNLRFLVEHAQRAIVEKDKEIERLRGCLSNLVEAVDVLIAESDGVYGLHRNGDPAPWGELTAGGQFEAWLLALEDARAVLEEEEAAVASPRSR